MYKASLVLFLAVLAALPALAQQRTEAGARREAMAFLSANGIEPAAAKSAAKKASPAKLESVSLVKLGLDNVADAEGQPFYVFNTSPGFVIVSGDERTPAVLGWSDEGSIDTANMPDAFRCLLEGYAQTIMSLPSANSSEGKALAAKLKATPRKAQAKHTAIETLMSTQWGQDPSGYSFPNGGPSGCVATAVAQVMYYWHTKGFDGNQTQTIPAYTTKSQGVSISSESGPYTFSWSSMGTHGNNEYAGELMSRFGRAVHMDYVSDGSDSYLAEIPYALRTYFGYDKGVHAVYRHDYTADEWDNLIYNELAAGRPVVFGGCAVNSSSLSGHCFVCDGYATSKTTNDGGWPWGGETTTYGDYYHFNWGWGWSRPNYDGYFLLTALNPYGEDVQSYCFNTYVDAVIGFQPPRNNTTPYSDGIPRLTCADFTFSGPQTYSRVKRTDDFTGVNIYNALFNCMDEPTSMVGRAYYPDFDMGIGLYDKEGTLLRVLAERHYGEFTIKDGFGESFCFDGLSLGAELPYGDYFIKPISRKHGEKEWQADKGSDRHYITASITEQTLTLNPSAYLAYNNGALVNNGSEETSSILFQWSNSSQWWESSESFSSLQTCVPSHGSMDAGISSDITKLTSDMGGKNILYPTSNSNYIALSDSIDRHFSDKFVVIGNDLNVKVTLSNKGNDYEGTISASLSPSATSKSTSQEVNVAEGKSATATFSFTNLTYDRQYTLRISAGSESRDTTFTVKRGIVIGYGDGSQSYVLDGSAMNIPDNAVWVDARYSQDASSITPSANPNCLYVLASNATTPDKLKGKNVVIGSKADNISLADNEYGFDTPVEFTADNISYSRTFTEGYDGKNAHWSTLVLPFAVTGVTGANYKGWFKSSIDNGKNMWLMDFSRESNNTVFFRYATEIEAYKPYIITVAANAWGESWNLVGKTLTFTGSNAKITPRSRALTTGSTHDFVGRTFGLPRHYIYELNADGDNFASQPHEPSFGAFRAYFLDFGSSASSAKSMRIAIDDGSTTGISVLPSPQGGAKDNDGWFDLQGRRLGGQPAHEGIYIKGNKKVVVGE